MIDTPFHEAYGTCKLFIWWNYKLHFFPPPWDFKRQSSNLNAAWFECQAVNVPELIFYFCMPVHSHRCANGFFGSCFALFSSNCCLQFRRYRCAQFIILKLFWAFMKAIFFAWFSENYWWKTCFCKSNMNIRFFVINHDLNNKHTCKWCLQDEKWIDPPSQFEEKIATYAIFLFASIKQNKSMFAIGEIENIFTMKFFLSFKSRQRNRIEIFKLCLFVCNLSMIWISNIPTNSCFKLEN